MVAMMIVFLYFADDQIESRLIYYYVSITWRRIQKKSRDSLFSLLKYQGR